jgi:hypothetical protein
MNDTANNLPAGATHVIDAIVGVTTPSSTVAEKRTFQEVLDELTPIMEPDLRTYLHSNVIPGVEYTILRSRDEYFDFLRRFTQLVKDLESNVQSVAGNETFFNSMTKISAVWIDGHKATWWLCIVGRYSEERKIAELWIISSRDTGPHFGPESN